MQIKFLFLHLILNTNLIDDAWNILDVVSGAGGQPRGLEVWRRLCDDIVNKSSAERLLMEDHMLRPAPCKGIDDVMSRIDSWDVERQAWVRSGGRLLDEHELVGIRVAAEKHLPEEGCSLDAEGCSLGAFIGPCKHALVSASAQTT